MKITKDPQMQPVIKWTGSKRSQAKEILKRFPKKISTYYEPFVGGGSVLAELLRSDIQVDKYIVSDINESLIECWQLIKIHPEVLIDSYRNSWELFNESSDPDHRKYVFETIKKRFNAEHRPEDLFFLMRTAFSGLVRYNSRGEYNSSCHFSRPGIHPDKLRDIVLDWYQLLHGQNVEFHCQDYRKILVDASREDFVYMDPPYLNTSGIYFGDISFEDFWSTVENLPCDWLVSYNGHEENIECTVEVPKIYTGVEEINAGKSSFRKLTCSGDKTIYERLYIKKQE